MIGIITRTSNRPNFFSRCHSSIQKQRNKYNHYVIYDNSLDVRYITGNRVFPIFINRNNLEQLKRSPIPTSARPPILSIHNLYFNHAYDHVTEDWIYHLDDDNYLLPNSLDKIEPHLTSDIDLLVCRINHFTGNLPRDVDFKNHIIRVGGIDTACFFVRKDLAKRVLWDEWKCGDFRFIKECNRLSKKTKWVNINVAAMEIQNLGNRKDM